jgi:pyruvate ferredoxin oxidoreductase delta subunit
MKLHYAFLVRPRTSLSSKTGTWRLSRPVLDKSKCSRCGICELYCPDVCIVAASGDYMIDYDYCKGCGICAHECPTGAIEMIPEEM